jgi:hypothetical protein
LISPIHEKCPEFVYTEIEQASSMLSERLMKATTAYLYGSEILLSSVRILRIASIKSVVIRGSLSPIDTNIALPYIGSKFRPRLSREQGEGGVY